MRASSSLRLHRTRVCRASALERLRGSALASRVSISPEIQDALHRSQPVVSLESAITSHGLPFQQAVSVAKSLDSIIRQVGAIPAAIGLIDGVVKIGLSDAEIERLADQNSGVDKWKVGRRDLAPALVRRVDGGTTVSATSFLSHLVGIETFVTGGIGGVHRGAQETMDISSDLTELGKTPVAVICAGAKSILDIGLTLEYLETLGVTVASFGPTKAFPAFYSRNSGFDAPVNVRTAREAAELIYFSNILDTQTGTLIGVPIPQEHEARAAKIQKAAEQAVAEAQENGIARRGKEVTPWILARVKELSGGESVESNIALIENNARVGAAIAVELAKIKASGETGPPQPRITRCSQIRQPAPQDALVAHNGDQAAGASQSKYNQQAKPGSTSLLVLGGAAVDIVAKAPSLDLHSTVPGHVQISLGGVARNVHEAAFRSGLDDAVLAAPIGEGEDHLAAILKSGLESMGARTDGLMRMSGRTPSVNLLLDGQSNLHAGVADTSLVEQVSGDQVQDVLSRFKPKMVCFDGNLSRPTIKRLLQECRAQSIQTAFEPTSNVKALRLLDAIDFSQEELTYMAPNVFELRTLYQNVQDRELLDKSPYFRSFVLGISSNEAFRNQMSSNLPPWLAQEGVVQMALQMLAFTRSLVVKLGSRGLLIATKAAAEQGALFMSAGSRPDQTGAVHDSSNDVKGTQAVVVPCSAGSLVLQHFNALPLPEDPVSVVGGGDSLLGALLAGACRGIDIRTPKGMAALAGIGQRAAVASLCSENSVGNIQRLDGLPFQ